ncbi:hypothetical protein B7P43_G11212 [Cryptotermes secundus]|uniref:MRG-binding protein n=2 Tax=Cryptotermes secundus TaxID=105785 RepID=A0A2J7R0Y0_9NEOP|nr:MRG/MORF4L-binding protein isoform X1 [Cryptotermes secundus]PNF34488.1 hypothetical protein B7P43_G11212 [Cryptotermes secundus]PNF34489.1 hypothetical protein B7P43_G11212 [Cryptotermes secundus]
MAVKEKTESVVDGIEWNVDTEVQLFYAMHGHKPVGVNKYFQMACILEKFRNSINRDITSKVIWDHLDTMYDMQALDDTENLPFPNDEREFCLPEADFANMMKDKLQQEKTDSDVEPDTETKLEQKKESGKSAKEVTKKESSKDLKENSLKKDSKESKDVNKDRKDKEVTKESKKFSGKDIKDGRRESKDGKESKKDNKKDIKEVPKETKKESTESKDPKPVKSRGSIKEKKEVKKEDEKDESLATYVNSVKRERIRELSDSKSDDCSPKRVAKRSTRGSLKPDDTSSNKSSSPITTPTPPPSKRRRT